MAQNPNLQYGPGYRQSPIAGPGGVSQGQGLTAPVPAGAANPVDLVNAIKAKQGQIQPGNANYEALAQALAAKQAQGQSERFDRSARGAFMQPGKGKSAALGGLNALLRDRKEKQAQEAKLEALRLQDDDAQIKEMEQRKAIFSVLKSSQPNMSDTDALQAAKAISAGFAELSDFMPKAKDLKGLEAEHATLQQLYGPEEALRMIKTKYQGEGEGDEDIPFAKMGAENRVKLGLIASSANLLNQALPVMFEGDEYRNMASMAPKGEVGIALADLRESLTQTLRATSGAAIPETEIEREVDSMMPGVTDSDKQARAKIGRIEGKLNRLHSALTGGYRGIPENLLLPDFMGFSEPNGADGFELMSVE